LKTQFDSLRPFEKRVVVGVAAMLFVVLNLWLVFPYFSKWGEMQTRMASAQAKLGKYHTAIAQTPTLQAAINKLMAGGNSEIPIEEQGGQFQRTIQVQQAQSGVNLVSSGKITTRTNNPYFVELTQTISVQSKEEQLVDFLYNLGQDTSLIRVRGLTLHPDPPRYSLNASITLVASYQKNLKPGTAKSKQTLTKR